MKLKHIEDLLDGEGSITLGAVGGVGCAAVATDGNDSVAMLVRRPGESVEKLLRRLDAAIGVAIESGEYIDEVNG